MRHSIIIIIVSVVLLALIIGSIFIFHKSSSIPSVIPPNSTIIPYKPPPVPPIPQIPVIPAPPLILPIPPVKPVYKLLNTTTLFTETPSGITVELPTFSPTFTVNSGQYLQLSTISTQVYATGPTQNLTFVVFNMSSPETIHSAFAPVFLTTKYSTSYFKATVDKSTNSPYCTYNVVNSPMLNPGTYIIVVMSPNATNQHVMISNTGSIMISATASIYT